MKKIKKGKLIDFNRGDVYHKVIGDTERNLIEEALRRSFGNQTIASKILGINRNTLRFKIKKFGINTRKYKI
ncbi:MAG: hypothetical protein GF409_05590 [Candidatus Omnitrophica bacterium]|nr:hypothetical protein [Candidatus Omnitrophota bacterium]